MRVSISLFGIVLVGALMHAAARADKEPLFGPPPLAGIAQREVVLAEDQAGSTQDFPAAAAPG